MAQNSLDWDLELEESAQGTDSFTAPGAGIQANEAREGARELEAGDLGDSVSSHRVEKARVRRHLLGDALGIVELAVARPSAFQGWLEGVSEGLAELRRALEEHIEVTEGPEGLLEEIGTMTPRLSNEIALIESEHDQLLDLLEMAVAAMEQSTDSKAVRNRVMAVLAQLSLHRQRGADLVYEAYNVDIAAGD